MAHMAGNLGGRGGTAVGGRGGCGFMRSACQHVQAHYLLALHWE